MHKNKREHYQNIVSRLSIRIKEKKNEYKISYEICHLNTREKKILHITYTYT